MTYKTILVHVDSSKHSAPRVNAAAALALAQDAHLVGAATTGISPYSAAMIPIVGADLFGNFDLLRERTQQALSVFATTARQAGVATSEKRMVEEESNAGMCLQARYADLVVLSQTDPEETTNVSPEYVAMNCSRPVLVLPHSGSFKQIGKKVLIAWDGSIEATRAVTNAIPLLRQADLVQVAIFNSKSRADAHGAEPGADIALYLARHKVKVEVVKQETEIDIGNALLSLAHDLSSDLLVMGVYGHSRFQEMLLGGVTRTILKSMTVPVLMSH